MGRIGIFSGTFDPVHMGHIAFCKAAMERAELDKVVLLPEAEPRDKAGVTPLASRQAMLQLATSGLPNFEVLVLSSRQFTVPKTLPELRRHFLEDELVLLVGSDVARTFAYRWPGLAQLLKQVELVIGLRQRDSAAEIDVLMRELGKTYALKVRYQCVPSPQAHAASKAVRLGQHGAVDLDPKVARYIAKQQLYDAYLGHN